ncbi:hypothetical protein [Leifsonia sp. C5G2]|uniref:hypothetical protein n=1 Tax=Leifsonia sp. C5G2 TaxID=2735269 RepID=UPI001585834C|nr:hypothetical protein [Leifsonia sp. C5G2]NUU07114.1 hypothetical protein [Leifsonia sp. C5G2]
MRSSTRRTLAVCVGVLFVGFGLYAGVMQLGAAWKNPCSRFGTPPPGAVVSETPAVVGEQRSFWPIGSVCDWRRADGRGTVRSDNGDLALSAATYAAIGGGLTLAVLGGRPRRP